MRYPHVKGRFISAFHRVRQAHDVTLSASAFHAALELLSQGVGYSAAQTRQSWPLIEPRINAKAPDKRPSEKT